MHIIFKGQKEQQLFESSKELKRKFGPDLAKKLMKRLSELAAVDSLAQVSQLPPARCHPLKGDRKGQYAVDLKQPFRLIFDVAQDPVPYRSDGSVDISKVKAVRIVGVEDYHD